MGGPAGGGLRLAFAGLAILRGDRRDDQHEGGQPQQIEPASLLDRDIGEDEQGLVEAEQPEGEGKGEEQAVASALPEAQEMKPAEQEAEGDGAGQEVEQGHRPSSTSQV